MKKMISLLMSPEGMGVLVIGGGMVALRKCMHFKGADITLISEEIVPGIEDAAGNVIKKKVTAAEIKGLMSGYDIIIAATNDAAVNSEIRDEALRRGLYVNSAHGGGKLLIPSVLRRDRYTVSVSSEGTLPAFPPYVVEELETFLDERFDVMFDVLAESRKMCAGKGTQAERAEFLRKVAHDPEVRAFATAGDKESALGRAKALGVPQ